MQVWAEFMQVACYAIVDLHFGRSMARYFTSKKGVLAR